MSGWQLPSDDERRRQRDRIAHARAMAKPLTDAEIAEIDDVWSAPGIHQFKGMDASLVYRILATLRDRTEGFSRTSD